MQSLADLSDLSDHPVQPPKGKKRSVKPLPQSDLFSKREAAAYLGMSTKTLMKRVKDGEIAVLVGPHFTSPYQFKKSVLDKYNEEREVTYPKKKPK